ncbi:auxin-responsive protein SAUR50 [Canna indica]|uniref:Auxin-responsive protein SAUR50 n=1 Tax=Canna indica TaxID=4628 RepID=A0AAQ3QPU4_9LILI|nr:auxin-responsive protein SAUR50 [Canna indica]
MKMSSMKLLRAFHKKLKKIGNEKSLWAILTCIEERNIPRDVPKGHMVVYVGDKRKRFIIRITFLEHPLFQVLLDQAQEEYEFQPFSKLCIPCDENVFIAILHYVNSEQGQRFWFCC